jgi:hypothetical protein
VQIKLRQELDLRLGQQRGPDVAGQVHGLRFRRQDLEIGCRPRRQIGERLVQFVQDGGIGQVGTVPIPMRVGGVIDLVSALRCRQCRTKVKDLGLAVRLQIGRQLFQT